MTNNMNEMYKGENNMNTKETMINKAVFREIEGENKMTKKQTSRMNKGENKTMTNKFRTLAKITLATAAIGSYIPQVTTLVNADGETTAQLKEQMDQAYNSLETAKYAVEDAQNVKNNALDVYIKERDNYRNAETELADAKKAYEEATKNGVTQEDVDAAMKVVEEKQAIVDELKPVYDKAKADFESAKQTLETAEQTLAAVQASYDTSKANYDQAVIEDQKAEEERLASEQAKKDAEEAKKQAEEENKKADTTLSNAEQTKQDAEAKVDEAASSETDAKNDYDHTQTEADAKKDTLAAEQTKEDAVKDQLNQANSTVEQTKNDVDSSKQFVDEAKSGYESADAEASAKEDAANKAEADTKEGSEEYDAVNKDLTDKKAEVDSAKELLDEKTADVEEKKDTVEEAKKALDEANTELEGKKTELENAKSNVTNKEKALEDAKKALDTAKGDTTEKLQAVEDAKQALLDAQTKAKEAEDAYNEAVNNQEDAQIALEKAKVDAENAEKVQDAAQKAFDNASIYQKVVFGTDESLYPYISEVNRTLDLRPAEAGDSAVTYRVYHKKGETSEVNDYYSRQIKSTGVITPIIETWYWHNSGSGVSYGSMEKPDDMTNVTVENKTLAGTYYIVAEWEGGSKQYLVEIKDYKTEYCNQTVANKNTEIISSVNTEGMSEEEKIRAITKYIAENYKYDARHSSAYTMYQNGGGDCWASTDAIVRLAKQLGFEAWSHDARYEGGAGSGHANAMVKTSDGRYFVCEAGFSQYNADGKRPFAVNEVDPYDVNSGTLFRVNAPDITDVVVPEGVTEIGEIPSRNGTFSAVSGVNKLNSVRVSSTVTDIAVSNFTAAGNLADWTVDENNSTFSGNAHGDILSKDGTALYHANPKTAVLEIPSTVKTMKEYAIYGWNAETQQIILNEGLETLEQGAIYYTKVKKIVFPSTLKYVDKYALFQHESGSTFVFKSMDTVFDADALNTNSQLFTSSDTIIAPKGSTAEAAAKACGAKYVELSADTDLSLPEVVEKPKVTKTEKLTITNKSDAETQAKIAKAQAELDAAKKDYASKKGIYDS